MRAHRLSRMAELSRQVLSLVAVADLCLAQQAGTHPDRRYVDESLPVTQRVRIGGPASPLPITMSASPIASIGGEDPTEDYLFADIGGVAITSKGVIAVVDRKVQNLRLFDSRGQLLQKLGRAGQGPGEFRAPHTIVATARDELWVVDMQRRLSVFAPAPSGYAFQLANPVDGGIRGICRVRGQLVANAASTTESTSMRLIDSAGRSLRNFGRLYSSPNAMINFQFAEGLVACDEASGIIVYASNAALGEIRGYRPSGELAWRTVVDGLEHNVIAETQGGGIQVTAGRNGAHSLLSLVAIPDVGVLLQYGHRTPGQMAAKEGATAAVTILVNPSTGAGTVSSTPLPRVGAVAGSRAVVVIEDPAPHLQVREVARRR